MIIFLPVLVSSQHHDRIEREIYKYICLPSILLGCCTRFCYLCLLCRKSGTIFCFNRRHFCWTHLQNAESEDFFYINIHLFIHAPPQMCIQILTQPYCAQYMQVSACILENTEQSAAVPQKTMGGSLEYRSPQFKPNLVMAFKKYMAKWSLQS